MLAKLSFAYRSLQLGLRGHPGRFPALFFMIMGFLIPLNNTGSYRAAIAGVVIMSIFWIPVTWTAYRAGRDKLLCDRFFDRLEQTKPE